MICEDPKVDTPTVKNIWKHWRDGKRYGRAKCLNCGGGPARVVEVAGVWIFTGKHEVPK